MGFIAISSMFESSYLAMIITCHIATHWKCRRASDGWAVTDDLLELTELGQKGMMSTILTPCTVRTNFAALIAMLPVVLPCPFQGGSYFCNEFTWMFCGCAPLHFHPLYSREAGYEEALCRIKIVCLWPNQSGLHLLLTQYLVIPRLEALLILFFPDEWIHRPVQLASKGSMPQFQ